MERNKHSQMTSRQPASRGTKAAYGDEMHFEWQDHARSYSDNQLIRIKEAGFDPRIFERKVGGSFIGNTRPLLPYSSGHLSC